MKNVVGFVFSCRRRGRHFRENNRCRRRLEVAVVLYVREPDRTSPTTTAAFAQTSPLARTFREIFVGDLMSAELVLCDADVEYQFRDRQMIQCELGSWELVGGLQTKKRYIHPR